MWSSYIFKAATEKPKYNFENNFPNVTCSCQIQLTKGERQKRQGRAGHRAQAALGGLYRRGREKIPPGKRAHVVKTGQGARESHISVIKISLHVQLGQNLHILITRKTTLSRLKTHRVGTDHTSE